MNRMSLNGAWSMRCTQDREFLPATVPGSVLADLLNNHQIDDPFYRKNEYKTRDLFEKDYEYVREFTVSKEFLSEETCELVCNGLDTLAKIYINDVFFHETDNMHRTWRFDVKHVLNAGSNTIRIVFDSPLAYIRDALANCDEQIDYTSTGSTPGNGFLRKSHCMFGWDWGPQLPDAGIWRDIELQAYSHGRISDFKLHQAHSEGNVHLSLELEFEYLQEEPYQIKVYWTSPDKKTTTHCFQPTDDLCWDENEPKLWWPNGYGEQPLYHLKIELCAQDTVCEEKEVQIGLRTLTVSTEKDEWGNEFCFTVNGVKLFAMGADYIPEDNILSRVTPEKTEQLIRSCTQANFNSIRVWGGAHYPDDSFYELCDKYGLIVWQDLMFACNVYRFTKEFEENIVEEIKDNVRRIRHHACLGLWCGNNEMESGWVEWDRVKFHSPQLKADYIKQFEYVMPQVVKKEDPDTFYWNSSPSSKGCFDDPSDPNRGDVHYWDVWHKLEPFTKYRSQYFRFCSEFGFQSFPCLKTVKSFTLPKDRNIFSSVMESHQKNGNANGRILFYLSDYFCFPKDFDSMLYVSQLLQADAIKYGVEHWRRNRGRCMGAIYWQLNDCWPVASWASIDYFGRWKALHYAAKKFFAHKLVTALDNDTKVDFYVHNEDAEEFDATLQISLRTFDFATISQQEIDCTCEARTAKCVHTMDFANACEKYGRDSIFVEYQLLIAGESVSQGTVTFVRPKHLELQTPKYSVAVNEDAESFNINVKSNTFAPYLEVSTEDLDVIFSDNYCAISDKNGVNLTVKKQELPETMTAQELKQRIKVRSLADSFVAE